MKLKKKRLKVWCPDRSRFDFSKRKHVRCPTCNRRLLLSEVCDFPMADTEEGRSHVCWEIPPHKTYKKIEDYRS